MMIVPILVFFLAIFGGMLFLLFLMQFFIRRRHPRNFTRDHSETSETVHGSIMNNESIVDSNNDDFSAVNKD